MKSFVLAIAMMLTSASSQAFYVPQVNYQITPNVVTAQVYNSTGYNLFCQGWVYGYTQAGTYQTAWFNSYIAPFNYAYAYVYAYAPYYFHSAWSDVRCR